MTTFDPTTDELPEEAVKVLRALDDGHDPGREGDADDWLEWCTSKGLAHYVRDSMIVGPGLLLELTGIGRIALRRASNPTPAVAVDVPVPEPVPAPATSLPPEPVVPLMESDDPPKPAPVPEPASSLPPEAAGGETPGGKVEGKASPAGDEWQDYRDGPGGELLTTTYIWKRYKIPRSAFSKDAAAMESRRKKPKGKGFVYRADVVHLLSNRREAADEEH